MDYYNKNDPACEGYRVDYKGTFRDDAVEASQSEGWVRVEREVKIGWGQTHTKRETLYGRVFIVRYIDHEPDPVDENPEPTYD